MISAIGTAALSITVFLLLFWKSGITSLANKAIQTTYNALQIMRIKSLPDIQKEKAVQQAAITQIGLFFSIVIRCLIVFAGSLLPIWFADLLGIASIKITVDLLSQWEVITSTFVLIILGVYLVRLRRQ